MSGKGSYIAGIIKSKEYDMEHPNLNDSVTPDPRVFVEVPEDDIDFCQGLAEKLGKERMRRILSGS